MMLNRVNILVIDDSEGDAKLVKIFLKQASLKHDFFYAETLYEGIEICEEKPIDLVLLDLSLPDSRGLRTLSSFLERCPKKLPVVVMTGTTDEMVGEQAVRAGAQDYLVKGEFDHKSLARSIRHTLARHRTYVQLQVAVKELNIVKERFELASKMSNFGIWEIDIVTNEMNWSEQVYKIFGFEPGHISPSWTDYLNYIYPEDREKVEREIEAATKDGALHSVDYRIRVGVAQKKHVANQFQISYDPSTEKTLLVGVAQDITEQKMAEELRELKTITDRTSKIKEEILEDMSFHIRTPLSSIVNLSYTLESSELNSQQEELVSGMQQSVSDLSLAVNNMLNFSVLLSDKITVDREQFAIRNTVQGLEKMFQIKSNKKDIEFKLDVNENVPKYLIGDETKINQILYNLLDNAIKYTEKSGQVKLAIEAANIDIEKATITFEVEDNGVGMSADKIKEILNTDRLLNADSDEKEGLGLAIARRLAETMGGTLRVNSEEGEGSTFLVEIDLNIAEIAVQQIGGKPIKPMNILFVEDHFLNQIATKQMLTTWSDYVKVEIAENGKLGVEAFEKNNYDVILMDLQMPVMNGFEAAAKIRITDSDIPIIALSANTSKTEAEKCSATGINDYLAKPYNPEELKGKIMTLVYRNRPSRSNGGE